MDSETRFKCQAAADAIVRFQLAQRPLDPEVQKIIRSVWAEELGNAPKLESTESIERMADELLWHINE